MPVPTFGWLAHGLHPMRHHRRGDESQPAGKNPHNQPAPLTVNLNIVRGVGPAGQIWVINSLTASVQSGKLVNDLKGTGLVLAGGNNAGRAPSGTAALHVFATLICTAPAPAGQPQPTFPQFNTPSAGVLLSPTGNFTIPAGTLLSPTPPDSCPSPMLLIRNAATPSTSPFPNPWLAVGIYSG